MKWLRGLRDVWTIAGITLLLILVGDALLAKWLAASAPTVEAGASAPDEDSAPPNLGQDWLDAYVGEHRAAKAMNWQSYVYWRRQPFAGTQINVDEDGLRRTVQPAEPPVGQVWIMGGSAVWGSGVPDQHTVPSALSRILAEQGAPMAVTNFGESGYVSTQSLITLIENLAWRSPPDFVVFVEGANDVYAALQEGRAGTPQNEANRRAEFRASTGFDNWLAMFPALLEGVRGLAAAPAQPGTVDDLAAAIVERYRYNIDLATLMGARHGFEVLAYWQPTVFGREQPAPYEREVVAASLRAHRDLQVAADELVARSATGQPSLTDLGSAFDAMTEAVFVDFVHLGVQGNERIAALIAADLLARMAVPNNQDVDIDLAVDGPP